MAERVVKVRLSAQVAEYVAAMEQAAAKTRETGSETEKLAQKRQAFQQLGTALTVLGGAMTALTLSVAKTGIEYNTLQQTSRAALTTLLGGAEQANAQMDKLDAFARTSPFSKAVFIQAQQQMLAFGIEASKVVPYLDAIQDAVAAAGGGNQELQEIAFIMAQISSAGKITAQDLMQFGQRGVNAAELIGSQMGKTGAQIREEITAGTLGADEALDALAGGMKENFDGAAASVKDTFAGALDRVKAAWRDLSADLMKPLVDPNGGGALVGVLNWAADVMRAFQALPEPIKLVSGALFAVVGVVALVGGAALLAIPKIAEFKVALQTLAGTGTKVRSGLAGVASFLGGPWGIAMLAATAAFVSFNKAIEAGTPKHADIANALKTSTSAVEAFNKAFEYDGFAGWWFGDLKAELADLPGLLSKVNDNMPDFLQLSVGEKGALDSIHEYGKALAELAQSDMPAAAEQFRELAEAKNLTTEQARQLLREMPELYDAFAQMATEQGIATDSSEFMAMVLGELSGPLEDTSDGLTDVEQAAADAEQALAAANDALDALVDTAQAAGEAHDEATSAINAMKEAAKEEGVTINGTNDQSIKFRDTMRDVTDSHLDSAKAILQNGGTLKDAKKEWDRGRESVIKMLMAKGMDRSEAKKWADDNLGSSKKVKKGLNDVSDEIKRMPKKPKIRIQVNTSEAKRGIDQFIRDNTGRTIRVRVAADGSSINYGGKIVTPNANGGIYTNKMKAFALGGVEPGIYPYTPGGIHKFAEESPEAYISMDPRRRDRSYGVWQEVGNRFGFQQTPTVNVSGGIQPGDRLVLEVEGTPLTAVARRVVKAEFASPMSAFASTAV